MLTMQNKKRRGHDRSATNRTLQEASSNVWMVTSSETQFAEPKGRNSTCKGWGSFYKDFPPRSKRLETPTSTEAQSLRAGSSSFMVIGITGGTSTVSERLHMVCVVG